mgnify:CR=1 FL=1
MIARSEVIHEHIRMFHIVDDQAYLGEVLAETIKSFAYSAKAFSSPQAYIDHVQSTDFQMPLGTITDIDMPSD